MASHLPVVKMMVNLGARMNIDFELFGQITEAETFAIGPSIRELQELRARFGHGRWRKRKGIANVRLRGGTIRLAEVHWYEAHGIGKVRMKIKRYLD
jgi:hypothetical protein